MQFEITFIQNKKTGKREQYVGFFYNHKNGKYSDKEGYIICESDMVVLFYIENGKIAMEILDEYQIIIEKLGIN